MIEGLATIPATLAEGDLVSFERPCATPGTATPPSPSETRLRLDVGDDGTFDLTPANQATSAAAGAAEAETWSDAWTATAGTHRLEICADDASAIEQSDETNNCTTMTFTLSAEFER